MHSTPLLSAESLSELLGRPGVDLLVCDCSFDLADPAAGERAHAKARVPGAVYVHLDRAMSGHRTGQNGRHPLPRRDDFAATMALLGASDGTLVVAYDSVGGIYAARLWWMLRWAGHASAAVLDGGLQAWRSAGLPVDDGVEPARPAGMFSARSPLVQAVDYGTVLANLDSRERLVMDARAANRFRGENETLDPIGGHIPNAASRPCSDNLGQDGRFKPAGQLREEFQALLGGTPPASVISQCGSGVTACHNLLAMESAGLTGAALYPGSWSEWSSRPGAPIATGA